MSGLEVRVVDNVVVVAEGFGPAGPQGAGVPVGGTTGQVLAKVSNADNDTAWQDQSGGVGAAVLYTAQTLTAPQQTQGRSNIDAEQAGAAVDAVAAHAGATDPHGDRAFATAADATHVAASDPHGDRAFATAADAAPAAAAGAHPISGVDGLSAALALLAPLLSPALAGTPTTPTATAGTSTTQIASTEFVAAAIAALLNSAPGALDTLDELAAALGDDPNFATTITNALAGKLAKASNLSDLVDAAAARGNLGAGTVGGQVFVAATAAAIRTLLELGTAATTAATAYATAAQGATADTAVQPARSVSTQHSLSGGGDMTADRTLALVNDTASPGANKTYGTDAGGVRGWKDDPAGGGGASNLLPIDANEWIPRVTSGAGIHGSETGTNKVNVDQLAFDPGSAEYAHYWTWWPAGYTALRIADIAWDAVAGTPGQGVRFELSAICFGDGDSRDLAVGTAQGVSDVLVAIGNEHRTGPSATITPAGTVAAGARVLLQISRQPGHGDDGVSGDVLLNSVLIEWVA
jgi:hypothetical protein